MKRLFILLVSAGLLAGTNNYVHAQEGTKYGQEFSSQKAMTVQGLYKAMEKKDKITNVVVEGEVTEVCQAMGCWVKLKNDNGDDVFVKFKDHEFTVPKDIAGKYAYVSGTAMRKKISVKEQRHLAEDAGATKDDIAAIKDSKVEIRIEATGAIIK